MLTCYTQRFSAFDLHARAILGYPIDATLVTPGASVVIHADEELNEVAYTGVAAALSYAETDVKLFGKPGPTRAVAWAWCLPPRKARRRHATAQH